MRDQTTRWRTVWYIVVFSVLVNPVGWAGSLLGVAINRWRSRRTTPGGI